MTALRLHFHDDVSAFLAAAGDHLAADPVVSTVVAGAAQRTLAQIADGIAPPDRDWWLTVTDDAGTVAGVGMRSASSPPYPLFLLPMPDDAAVALAQVLHARNEEVLAVHGAVPAVFRCAEELIRFGGGHTEVSHHTRLHELTDLTWPAAVPGALVRVTEDGLEQAAQWYAAFMDDADEQAGRPRGASAHQAPERSELLRSISGGHLWFWVNAEGQPVHLIGTRPPSFGVARIGPVYTPPAERGRGWASNAVAELSRRLQSDGTRVCLFTDQANPTSNRIYAALGYRPVVDMADLAIVR